MGRMYYVVSLQCSGESNCNRVTLFTPVDLLQSFLFDCLSTQPDSVESPDLDKGAIPDYYREEQVNHCRGRRIDKCSSSSRLNYSSLSHSTYKGIESRLPSFLQVLSHPLSLQTEAELTYQRKFRPAESK